MNMIKPEIVLSTFIKKMLLERNMSKEDLAKEVGVETRMVDQIIRFEYDPTIELVSRIARAFGKTLQIKFV